VVGVSILVVNNRLCDLNFGFVLVKMGSLFRHFVSNYVWTMFP
jgi:hypothetical protein